MSVDIPGEAAAADTRIADPVSVAQNALAESLAAVIATPAEPERVGTSLARRVLKARIAIDWADAIAGGATMLHMEAAEGLRTPEFLPLLFGALLRIYTPDQALTPDTNAPRCGNVVHAEHSVARLRNFCCIETYSSAEECIALDFAGNAELLVRVGELNRIWRYSSSEGRIAHDRVGDDAGQRKRAETQGEIDTTAAYLAIAAAARARRPLLAIAPAAAPYTALARRFPPPPPCCKIIATDALLTDLASGRPMDRLLCGNVGFGKPRSPSAAPPLRRSPACAMSAPW